MKLNKDSFYGFVACAVLCATSLAIGANFQANPGREYFEACQAFQAESAASPNYSITANDDRKAKHTVRAMHWLKIMEKFEPDNAAAKKQFDLINDAKQRAQQK